MLKSDGSLAGEPCARRRPAGCQGRRPSAAPEPLTYLPELDALLRWLSLDVWIPALAEHAEDLAMRAGVTLDHPAEARVLVAATALFAEPSLPVDTAVPVGCDAACG